MRRILVIDDELAMPAASAEFLRAYSVAGFEFHFAGSLEAAEPILSLCFPSVSLVLLDIRFEGRGDQHGLAILSRLVARMPRLPVIIMSSRREPEILISAWELGARSYIVKWADNPHFAKELKQKIERTALYESVEPILGSSAPIRRLKALIDNVAPFDATILIEGETGTGKELVVEMLHAKGKRSTGPLVRVNCGAIPESLVASELFGYRKGSFTGATSDQKGKVEEAEGGILFLDEIGELRLEIQASLLCFLDKREFSRVGEASVRKADVQILAATNRKLKEAVAQGGFREDLYHRLNEFRIETPPLRDCKEDIPLLAEHFLELQRNRLFKPVTGFASDLLEFLTLYAWPGNVRELEKLVTRAYILTPSGEIPLTIVPEEIMNAFGTFQVGTEGGPTAICDLHRHQAIMAWRLIYTIAKQEIENGPVGLKRRIALRIGVNPVNGLARKLREIAQHAPELQQDIQKLLGPIRRDTKG